MLRGTLRFVCLVPDLLGQIISSKTFREMNAMKSLFLSAVFLLAVIGSAPAQTPLQTGTSAFATRPDDPRAVPLTGAVGDGKADDSAAIQAAIDKAAADREEGIVFIPQGR